MLSVDLIYHLHPLATSSVYPCLDVDSFYYTNFKDASLFKNIVHTLDVENWTFFIFSVICLKNIFIRCYFIYLTWFSIFPFFQFLLVNIFIGQIIIVAIIKYFLTYFPKCFKPNHFVYNIIDKYAPKTVIQFSRSWYHGRLYLIWALQQSIYNR